MKTFVISCSGVYTGFLLIFVTSSLVQGQPSTNLTALGTIRGKSYFSNGIVLLNWTASQSYCESKGMELATILNEKEANYLKSVYNAVNFNGCRNFRLFSSIGFWVAAKYTGSRYTWTKSGFRVTEFTKLYWQWWSAKDPREHCLVYSSNNHASSYYFKRACDHVHHVLCESMKPIEFFGDLVKNNTNPEEKLIDIGTLEGKTYFSDHVLRNYTDAEDYCHKNEMQLATLTRQALKGFLREACKKINLDGNFWVLGYEGPLQGNDVVHCPIFAVRQNSYGQRHCLSKQFTLCESVSSDKSLRNMNETQTAVPHQLESESDEESLNWDSWKDYEAHVFEEGIEEEEAEDEKQVLTSTDCQSKDSSHFLYIFTIIILVCVIIGMIIWQTKLWRRVYSPKLYFPVRKFLTVRIDRCNFTSETDLVLENPEV